LSLKENWCDGVRPCPGVVRAAAAGVVALTARGGGAHLCFPPIVTTALAPALLRLLAGAYTRPLFGLS
jgi:hypothetical protein